MWGNKFHSTCKDQAGFFSCAGVIKHSSKKVSDQLMPQPKSRKYPHPSICHLSIMHWRSDMHGKIRSWIHTLPVLVNIYTTDLMYKPIDLWGPQTKIPSRNVQLSTKEQLKSIQRLHHTDYGGDLNGECLLLNSFGKPSYLFWQCK